MAYVSPLQPTCNLGYPPVIPEGDLCVLNGLLGAAKLVEAL